MPTILFCIIESNLRIYYSKLFESGTKLNIWLLTLRSKKEIIEEMEILILVVLSIPVFYVMGIVYFVKLIAGRKKENTGDSQQKERELLVNIIEDLQAEEKKEPHRKIADLLLEYKERLRNLTPEVPMPAAAPFPAQEENPIQHEQRTQTTVSHTGSTLLSSNWYSTNSINVLLYIGAFLIVASASIFVGFQWETISGTIKALLLTCCAFTFFGFGMWFHAMPKVKLAGATFLAIGAVLIPFCGIAWYNFVLQFYGILPGAVWFFTSLIAILVYVGLAKVLKSTFYAYASSLATLSLSTSLVNAFQLNHDYYILAGILSGFLLFVASITAKQYAKEEETHFYEPLRISSHLMLPASLIYGLILASGSGKLLSFEAVLSVGIATLFYGLIYYMEKKPWALAVTEFLLLVTFALFCGWQHITTLIMLYLFLLMGFAYVLLSQLFEQKTHKEENDASFVIGFFTLVFVFFSSIFTGLEAIHVFFFSTALGIAGLIRCYFTKHIQYLLITAVSLAMSIFIMYDHVLNSFPDHGILALIYVLCGVCWYIAATFYKIKKDYVQTFSLASGLFLLLGFLFSFSLTGHLVFVLVVIALLFTHAAKTFSEMNYLYLANVFWYLALFNCLRLFTIQSVFYPLFFAGFSYALYFIGFLLPKEFQKHFQNSGLVGSAVTPLLFGIFYPQTYYRYSYNSFEQDTEQYALFSAYGTTVLFASDTMLRQKPGMGYAASAIGMFTYLWQMKFMGVNETLLYTMPLGVYFLVLGYLRKIKQDIRNMEILNLIGIFFMLAPSTILSFGYHAIRYSIILGITGFGFLFSGISLTYRKFIYAGIFGIVFAILPQTYQYILSLPRWLIVGAAGFLFLGIAIFLLVKRSEKTT